jgi:DNA-binding LytR/AlgR family response regulator
MLREILLADASEASKAPSLRGGREARCVEGSAAVMGGTRPGTNGTDLLTWLVGAAGPTVFAAVNIWTRLHDDPGLAHTGRTWEVVTWEVSSAVATLALMWLALRASRLLISHPLKVGSVLKVVGYALAFAALHIGSFVLLRSAIYRIAGSVYVFGGWDAWAYEAPKDLVTFTILVAGFATLHVVRGEPKADAPPQEAQIVVREGGRVHVLDQREVMAVSAAGNYVELHLESGRTILWRKSLIDTERDLGPMGFVRTHRGWLVNRRHVKEVRSAGSGDRKIILGGNLVVPLSRRFHEALAKIIE